MKKVITVKEAAEMLGISESLVRRKDMKAKLSAFIVGSRGIRFYRAKVQAYIRQNTVRTPDRDDDTPKKSKRKLRNLTSRHDLW